MSELRPISGLVNVGPIPCPGNQIDIFIDSGVTEADAKLYRDVILALDRAGENDQVIVRINTPGGTVREATHIVSALLETKAKTKAKVNCAYSAGSLIALACDSVEISSRSSMLIHSGWAGAVGKPEDALAWANFYKAWLGSCAKEIYGGFMSSKELAQMLAGKEFYMDASEIQRRLEKWTPIRQRKVK